LAHEQSPLSNDTIDSVLQLREVSRAKDLNQHPLVQVVTVSLNETPSQHFSSDSSLNFVGVNSEGEFKHVFP